MFFMFRYGRHCNTHHPVELESYTECRNDYTKVAFIVFYVAAFLLDVCESLFNLVDCCLPVFYSHHMQPGLTNLSMLIVSDVGDGIFLPESTDLLVNLAEAKNITVLQDVCYWMLAGPSFRGYVPLQLSVSRSC